MKHIRYLCFFALSLLNFLGNPIAVASTESDSGSLAKMLSEISRDHPLHVKISGSSSGHDLEKMAALPDSEKPIRVTTGMYIMSIDSLDYANNTFAATFWLWFVYDEKYADHINPHTTVDILNYISKDFSASFKEIKAGKTWAGVKVRGVFKHHWHLENYPNDVQDLSIHFDETDRESTELIYQPDVENSGYWAEEIKISGWEIMPNPRFELSHVRHQTTYGDPSLAGGFRPAEYTSMAGTIQIKRSAESTFLKLHMVIFVAFLISWGAMQINVAVSDFFAARIGIMVAMVYAVVLNMQYVDGFMGTVPTITLPDKLHFCTLFMIIVFSFTTIVARRLMDSGSLKKAAALERAVVFSTPVVYVAAQLLVVYRVV
jgi:hypothetical protein